MRLLKLINDAGVKYKILGNGSNLLFSDKNFEGIIIKLSEFDEISFFGGNKWLELERDIYYQSFLF